MIDRRFMIVPPALPSGGHAEQLEHTSKDLPRLLLKTANMRVASRETTSTAEKPLPAIHAQNVPMLARAILHFVSSSMQRSCALTSDGNICSHR
jgi:hypothetical protein